ncbi:MAG: hypothetical protein NC347_12315 [Clostridium sp.]|nr:hypothetical protein [Clostridium sp.]
MEWEKFNCCQQEPKFKKINNGYQCVYCGKFFKSESVEYRGKSFSFDKLKYQAKFRGDKADYLISEDEHIFAVMHPGIVDIMYLDNAHNVLDRKSVKVKKSVKEVRLNYNHTFLTITDRGVVDVYSMETGQSIAQYKSGRQCNCFKLNILPFGKQGNWLYIDTEKIIWFSNDFKESNTVLLFTDLFKDGAFSINGAMNFAENNSEYDRFAFHILYRDQIEGKNWLKRASIVLDYEKDVFNVKKIFYDAGYNMTYDFIKQKYFGAYNDDMVCMNERGEIEKIQKLPIIKKYSDGGGIFPLEEFIGFPEKIRFITDTKVALIYTFSIVILDIKEQEIVVSYHTKLILSFLIIDSETICFSAGINTYIVDLNNFPR